jgi:hypothetical protein
MDPSLVVLLCVFVLSVVVNGALVAVAWSRSLRSSQQTANLLSSAIEVSKSLEKTVAQRSSMADEVAALRQPLTESVVGARMLSEDLQKATREMAGNLIAVPKMVEVIAEMGKRQVAILEAVNKTAETLYGALHSKDAKAGYRPYDAVDADREYAIGELQRAHGLTRQEAEENVNSQKLWEGLSLNR